MNVGMSIPVTYMKTYTKYVDITIVLVVVKVAYTLAIAKPVRTKGTLRYIR